MPSLSCFCLQVVGCMVTMQLQAQASARPFLLGLAIMDAGQGHSRDDCASSMTVHDASAAD